MDDHHGIGDAGGFVNGLLVGRVEGIEGIEPAPEGIVYLRGLEGIEDLNRLPQSLAAGRSAASPGSRYRGVFPLRVHDANRSRPKN